MTAPASAKRRATGQRAAVHGQFDDADKSRDGQATAKAQHIIKRNFRQRSQAYGGQLEQHLAAGQGATHAEAETAASITGMKPATVYSAMITSMAKMTPARGV